MVVQPADGYFVCPEAGLICEVEGCQDGGCSIINNGFAESFVDDQVVYTALDANAALSISASGKTSQVICQDSCACQPIVRDLGCNTKQVVGDSEVVEGASQDNLVNVMLDNDSNASSLGVLFGAALFAFGIMLVL